MLEQLFDFEFVQLTYWMDFQMLDRLIKAITLQPVTGKGSQVKEKKKK